MNLILQSLHHIFKAFKVKHPIVLAPMGGISGSELVSAVSKVSKYTRYLTAIHPLSLT